ncbi:MAG: DUF6206 family protein [Bacteroidota bacterium]
MISLTTPQIAALLQDTAFKQTCSDCGYFSRPFRVNHEGQELIVKTFLPVRSREIVGSIIDNHNAYVARLCEIGINLPDTLINCLPQQGKQQLVIIQQPFAEDEMVRGMISKAALEEIEMLCRLMFADAILFANRTKAKGEIGFHPSLRNYAYSDGKLWYFDTFPPMLMDQRSLNRMIIAMSPYGRLIKKITPTRMINRVSNEYYYLPKMFIGIVGSCCRLRPELADEILSFSRNFATESELIADTERKAIVELLKTPPHLSKLWRVWRRLSGNIGKPNV